MAASLKNTRSAAETAKYATGRSLDDKRVDIKRDPQKSTGDLARPAKQPRLTNYLTVLELTIVM